jgi:hypothetical protein
MLGPTDQVCSVGAARTLAREREGGERGRDDRAQPREERPARLRREGAVLQEAKLKRVEVRQNIQEEGAT